MTEDEKFEERIRMIVRDELEAEWLEPLGYADKIRADCFNLTRAVLRAVAENILKSLPDEAGGSPKRE